MTYFDFLEKCLAGGFAAVGFALLFTSSRRTLISIFCLGMIGIIIKLVSLSFNLNIILASFLGASSIGILSQFIAYLKKAPLLVISIPAVIPMVPGKFLYNMMIGFVRMTSSLEEDEFISTLASTIHNGLHAVFILLVLSLGISIPYLISRKGSVDYLKKK